MTPCASSAPCNTDAASGIADQHVVDKPLVSCVSVSESTALIGQDSFRSASVAL